MLIQGKKYLVQISLLKGTVTGTISDVTGTFSLRVNQPPFTISISYVGFSTEEIEITDAQNVTGITVTLSQALLGEVVVTGNRTEENIMSSPVTIEKVDLVTIQQTTAPEFYDALANVKGVQVNSGSMNFSAVNTRGFATIANVRFVQLVDGMDTSAPFSIFQPEIL